MSLFSWVSMPTIACFSHSFSQIYRFWICPIFFFKQLNFIHLSCKNNNLTIFSLWIGFKTTSLCIILQYSWSLFLFCLKLKTVPLTFSMQMFNTTVHDKSTFILSLKYVKFKNESKSFDFCTLKLSCNLPTNYYIVIEVLITH